MGGTVSSVSDRDEPPQAVDARGPGPEADLKGEGERMNRCAGCASDTRCRPRHTFVSGDARDTGPLSSHPTSATARGQRAASAPSHDRATNTFRAKGTIMITTGAAVVELGTILGIWAHPDDEAYLSGGLMAVARDNGQRVVCVTATRGELGTPDPVAWPPDRLAAERTRELARCLHVLGVDEHHWLGYRDGECAEAETAAAVERLCELIDRVRPDTVVTFGRDGLTGHPDHRTVSAWTGAAFDHAAPRGARLLHATLAQRRAPRWSALTASLGIYPPGYPVLTPTDELAVDLVLPPEVARRKFRALAAQETQTTGLITALGVNRYTAWVGDESFVEAARHVGVAIDARLGAATDRGSGRWPAGPA
jgi:LmbE family N-acetylglucosaminyl deacetylase